MLKIAVLDDQELYLEAIEVITRNCMLEQGKSYELFTYNVIDLLK